MYRNILVPVLFDNEHDTQAAFAAARALADTGAKFTVLHVLEAIPAYAMSEIPEEVLAKTRQETQEMLTDFAKALPDASVVLISGHAGKAILDHATEHQVDCIVLASHRPGIEDFFLGSTASRVVRHAKCSVHVFR